MKLSTRARYALRMMVFIAGNGGDKRPVSVAEVAGQTTLSRGYLEQLAAALRRASMLRASSGRKGGYRLARPAAQISVGDIIEATIGPVCVVDCVDDPSTCKRAEICECRLVYSLINQRIAEVLRDCTLANLLDSDWFRSTSDVVARARAEHVASAARSESVIGRGTT